MHRLKFLVLGACLFYVHTAAAQTTTGATPAPAPTPAPATIMSDASGNLLVIERRAANSIPGAALTATGLVTRIVVVSPLAGSSPSATIYAGTLGAIYPGKKALYAVLTATDHGRPTRSLVAIDGGVNGVLQTALPSTPYTISGNVDVRISASGMNKDEIYLVQLPTLVRRTATGGTPPPTPNTRTITIVEFDGVKFSAPRSVTVQ